MDSTRLYTYIRSLSEVLWHQERAIVESVRYSISFTLSPIALLQMNANSAMYMTADNSFLGMVAFMSLDLEVNREQV